MKASSTIIWPLLAVFIMSSVSPSKAVGTDLRVSADQRYLEKTDGTPFYWMGDTGWCLPTRLTRADVELYLNNRQSKGVTVIQAVAHPWASFGAGYGPTESNPANAYGHRPFTGTAMDPNTASPAVAGGGTPDSPNDYWDHMDFIVREVRERGMHLALVPTWGRKYINAYTGADIEYTATEAKAYGEFLGTRYRNEPHIIWLNGGDSNPAQASNKSAVYRALAEGIVKGVSGAAVAYNEASPAWGTVLMCYHPPDGGLYFSGDAWLDFYMLQSGQNKPETVASFTAAAFAATPRKPVIMGESLYEGIVIWATGYDGNSPVEVRRSLYQSWFAGARGYTYGCHDTTLTSEDNVYGFGTGGSGWKNRLDTEAAMDLPHANSLLTSREWFKHVPDQAVITSGAGSGSLQKRASRSTDGNEILVYYPNNTTAGIENLLAVSANAHWFDPRNAATASAASFTPGQIRSMQPPSGWQDAVLILTATASGAAVVVDNADSTGVVTTGSWTPSISSAGYYGADYLHDGFTGQGSKSIRFTPVLPAAGTYEVFAIWTAHANRASNVPIDITHAGGTDGVQVNQQTNGGQWVSLGVYPFAAGSAGSVLIHNSGANGYVVADAVRFLPVAPQEVVVDNADPTGVTITGSWTSSSHSPGYHGGNYMHDGNTGKGTKSFRFAPTLAAAGNYDVQMRWTSDPNRASNVPIDITHAGGTDGVQVNQQTNGGQWVSLGVYPFAAGSAGSVLIGTAGTNGYVIADAVKFVKVP